MSGGPYHTHNGSSGLYSRVYFSLRAQRTILISIERALAACEDLETVDAIQTVEAFRQIVNKLVSNDYATIFQAAIGAVAEIKAWLTKSISMQIEKLGYSILSSSLAIARLLTLVMYEAVDEPFTRDEKSASKIAHQSDACENEQHVVDKTDDVFVVCRICEKKVSLRNIEAHSRSCVLAYESSKTMDSVDDRMRKLQAVARQTILKAEWPGDEEFAVAVVMPVLHCTVLLDRAIAADPSNGGGVDELMSVGDTLMMVSLFLANTEAEIVKKAGSLVSEKLNAATRLIHAMAVIRRTSLSQDCISVGQTTIANFQFIKRISSGAYARVFLAKKNRTGDIYAVKVLPKSGMQQKNELRRVLIEKDILLKVNSPFMVKFFYSIIGERNLYLVMEYLPGGDLYSILQEIGSLEEDDARVYAAQIVAALEFLRKNNVIHRDLKPDNILVDASGCLKLTDFGLSFFGTVDRSMTGGPVFDDSCVGTPDYTSPEIILSQKHTFAADYWALGSLLYEFLTGTPPFHGDTPSETFHNTIKGQYDMDALADLSAEVRDIISKLLCHDPDVRLGAHSIDEIKSHPWFSGIDWKNLSELDPPFMPELGSDTDTSYFSERCTFTGDNTDILEDVRISEQTLRDEACGSHRSSILSLLDDPSFDDLTEIEYDAIDSFSSVGVRQLQETTKADARRQRTLSGYDQDENVLPSVASLSTPKKSRRRRVPRVSLSPKGSSPGRGCSPGNSPGGDIF